MTVAAAELEQRRLDVSRRIDELKGEADALAARATDLLADGADARAEHRERVAVMGELESAKAAESRLRERVSSATRAELVREADEHLAGLRKRGGGLRGELSRTFERSATMLQNAVLEFEKAGGMLVALGVVQAEAARVAEVVGIEPIDISGADFWAETHAWRANQKELAPGAARRLELRLNGLRRAGPELSAEGSSLIERAEAARNECAE